VAVGAPYVALGDLGVDGLERETLPGHQAHVALLDAANVVELQDDGVSLTAVDARMGQK
jgi:hypothetical protein